MYVPRSVLRSLPTNVYKTLKELGGVGGAGGEYATAAGAHTSDDTADDNDAVVWSGEAGGACTGNGTKSIARQGLRLLTNSRVRF